LIVTRSDELSSLDEWRLLKPFHSMQAPNPRLEAGRPGLLETADFIEAAWTGTDELWSVVGS
jgi:hypothetical protein